MVGRQGRSPVFVADDSGFESYVTDHFYGGMSHGVTADCKSAAFTHSWFDSSPVDHFELIGLGYLYHNLIALTTLRLGEVINPLVVRRDSFSGKTAD